MHRSEDNIIMNTKEILCKDMDLILLPRDRVQSLAVAETVNNFHALKGCRYSDNMRNYKLCSKASAVQSYLQGYCNGLCVSFPILIIN